MKTNSWTSAGQAKDISSSPTPLVKVLRRGRHGVLNLILLLTTTPTFANSVDQDRMASEEAIWSGSTLFVIQFVTLNENIT